MKKRFISMLSMKKILKSAGAKKVSKEGASEMALRIENYAKELARRAVKNSLFAGRKTIKKQDITS